MKFNSKVDIHNKFKIEVRNAQTGELKQEAFAYNIVLDAMWSRLVNFQGYFTNIHFGTGTGTLAPSRTTLFTWLGQKTAVNVELIKAMPVSSWTRNCVLAPEEFVGSTLREVGIAYSATANQIVTHALLEDSEGNPISITKTALDVVTIFATVFVTFSTQDATKIKFVGMPNNNQLVNYLVGGTTFPTCQYYAGALPGARSETQQNITMALEGALGNTTTVTVANWVKDAANKKATTPAMRFGTTTANGHWAEIGFGASNTAPVFSSLLPIAGIFAGQVYTGVTVGTGNGAATQFNLPSRNVRSGSITMKVDGATTAHTANALVFLAGVNPPATLPGSNVFTLAWSPDGQYLAAGSATADATRFRWYKRTGDTLAELTQPATLPGSSMQILAWSPDGIYLAAGSNATDTTRFRWYKNLNNITKIAFDTPPANGTAITADYTVDGIHKTDQYVIDISIAIQYGEVTT